MSSKVFFLTHDFKPAFRRTLLRLDSRDGSKYEAEVLLDDRSEIPRDLELKRIKVTKCRRHPSPFDPLGQAHNFYLDLIDSDRSILDGHEFFWVFENDVYFNGELAEFMDAHEAFDDDLLVPELGRRDPKWCWLSSAKGIVTRPVGVTAVAYRASSRLMRGVLEWNSSGVEAHMEVLLPHLCYSKAMTASQFIPDLLGCCNTFPTPLSELIESEVKAGSSRFLQKKLYHPVKA